MPNLKILYVLLFSHLALSYCQDRVITRQGQISFFSYTAVENIEASNNQVHSIVDLSSNEVAVSMLMRAFVFKKALMEEHFNESYVESDIYPKLIFQGSLEDFDRASTDAQTRIINGTLDFHGVKREVSIKTKIDIVEGNYVFSGGLEIKIDDYDIKVPTLLAPNIAKTISIMFRFEYEPYEEK